MKAPAPTGLASRVAVYELAALGLVPFPGIPGCLVPSATAAAMVIDRRRDGDRLRAVLSLAGVSL